MKVLELIQGRGVEPGVRKAAWCQLAFLLEDPKLHHPFLQLCSLQYLVMNFVSMLKVSCLVMFVLMCYYLIGFRVRDKEAEVAIRVI